MIKPNRKMEEYEVIGFYNNGEVVKSIKEAAVIIAKSLSKNGIPSVPFHKKTLGNKVKIGDKFIVTTFILQEHPYCNCKKGKKHE